MSDRDNTTTTRLREPSVTQPVSSPSLYWLIVPLALCILLLDVLTSLNAVGGMPYVAVVLVALYSQERSFVVRVALACSVLTIVGFISSPDLGTADFGQALTNRLFGLVVLWMASGLSFRVPATLPARARFPAAVLASAMVLNVLVATGLGWVFLTDKRVNADGSRLNARITELRGMVLHYDEVLTMSARMAAATGSVHWENRYRRYENLLDTALSEVESLVPASMETAGAAKTALANSALVGMENQTFALVQAQRTDEALALLDSPEYQLQKRRYADGMAELSATLLADVEMRRAQDQQRIVVYSVLIGVIAILTLGVWAIVSRSMSQWRHAEEHYHEGLAAHAELLSERNAALDGIMRVVTEDMRQSLRAVKSDCSVLLQRIAGTVDGEDRALLSGVIGRIRDAEGVIAGVVDSTSETPEPARHSQMISRFSEVSEPDALAQRPAESILSDNA